MEFSLDERREVAFGGVDAPVRWQRCESRNRARPLAIVSGRG
jgi:hypothetical protein